MSEGSNKPKLRVYLDTSVISAFFDNRPTDRQEQTQQFWEKLDRFDVSTSEITRKELERTNDVALREKLQKALSQITVHPVTDVMVSLAKRYIQGGVFTPNMYNDSLHVAAAVTLHQDVLLSWNFKHMVNRWRRAMVNQINIANGLPTIEIVAPPEI